MIIFREGECGSNQSKVHLFLDMKGMLDYVGHKHGILNVVEHVNYQIVLNEYGLAKVFLMLDHHSAVGEFYRVDIPEQIGAQLVMDIAKGYSTPIVQLIQEFCCIFHPEYFVETRKKEIQDITNKLKYLSNSISKKLGMPIVTASHTSGFPNVSVDVENGSAFTMKALKSRKKKFSVPPRSYQIYAIDFDGTIVTSKWPEMGDPLWCMINAISNMQKAGHKFILWTNRQDDSPFVPGGLTDAVNLCKTWGIPPDAVNENLPDIIATFDNHNPRKITADYYIDDKSPGSIEWFLEKFNPVRGMSNDHSR